MEANNDFVYLGIFILLLGIGEVILTTTVLNRIRNGKMKSEPVIQDSLETRSIILLIGGIIFIILGISAIIKYS